MSIDARPHIAVDVNDHSTRESDHQDEEIPSGTDTLDPRISEIVGFADASRASGYSYWTFHNAYRRGEIRGVYVPGGAVGLLRVDVQRFIRLHRQRLRDRKTKAAAADSDVRSA